MATFKELLRSITSLNLAASGNNSQDAVDAIKIVPVANTAAADVLTITNAAMGQATTVTIPDPGSSTAKVVLSTAVTKAEADVLHSVTPGTVAASKALVVDSSSNLDSLGIKDLKIGATPVHQVDPASCTITAAAGATNTSTITVQLKDGAGNNLTRSVRFKVYASSAADGLTLASAASTGFSVDSGGLSLENGTAVTTQIEVMSSATGGAVLSLLDTGKQTSYLVLVLPSGNKISAQLTSGSYG